MILNPIEDFKNRTLSVFSSLLEKLQYVCSLQRKDGTYHHWGLTKAFGEQKAHKAVSGIHSELAVEMSRTPLREVYRQFQSSNSIPASSLVLTAPASADELLADHLRLIQNSVGTIADHENSSRRDA